MSFIVKQFYTFIFQFQFFRWISSFNIQLTVHFSTRRHACAFFSAIRHVFLLFYFIIAVSPGCANDEQHSNVERENQQGEKLEHCKNFLWVAADWQHNVRCVQWLNLKSYHAISKMDFDCFSLLSFPISPYRRACGAWQNVISFSIYLLLRKWGLTRAKILLIKKEKSAQSWKMCASTPPDPDSRGPYAMRARARSIVNRH